MLPPGDIPGTSESTSSFCHPINFSSSQGRATSASLFEPVAQFSAPRGLCYSPLCRIPVHACSGHTNTPHQKHNASTSTGTALSVIGIDMQCFLPVPIAQAPVGLCLILHTVQALSHRQVLFVILYSFLKISQSLVTISQVPICSAPI